MRTSRVFVSPSIEYSPLPPIIPKLACALPAVFAPLLAFRFSTAIPFSSVLESLFAQIDRLKFHFAVMFMQRRRRKIRVVPEG